MFRGGLAAFCVFAATAALAAEPPALRDADRIRLAEAFRIAEQLGEATISTSISSNLRPKQMTTCPITHFHESGRY